MPTAVTEEPDGDEILQKALKTHIMRERQRKKQEREAKVEEERLRKEREARERQNVMTLGETREQLAELEAKLVQLKEEKHQLFLQLKKVLNEDDNRRRQLHKETNEIPVQVVPGLPHQPHPLYVTQPMQRSAPVPQTAFKQTTKRPRSPSPTPNVPPVSMYPTYNSYKPSVTAQSYHSPQKDEIRRHDFVRAVLRAKTPQYGNQPTFYQVPQELAIFPPYLQSREPTRVYENTRVGYIDQKPLEHYPLGPQPPHLLHGTQIPITPAQPKNTGSITAGYPIRSQPQYQPSPAAAAYTTQSRPVYQSPNTPMNYPRE